MELKKHFFMEKNGNKKELHVSDAVRLDWVAVCQDSRADDAEPRDFQSAAGVMGENAWRCGVWLLDGFLPVGVGEQEVRYKLRAAWTLASQEASIQMTYFHANLPLYKRVRDPSPPPTPQSCTACTAGLSGFQQRVKCGSGKPLVVANLIKVNFFFLFLLSPSAKNPRREMLEVDNAVRKSAWAA